MPWCVERSACQGLGHTWVHIDHTSQTYPNPSRQAKQLLEAEAGRLAAEGRAGDLEDELKQLNAKVRMYIYMCVYI